VFICVIYNGIVAEGTENPCTGYGGERFVISLRHVQNNFFLSKYISEAVTVKYNSMRLPGASMWLPASSPMLEP